MSRLILFLSALVICNIANADVWINEIAWSGTPNSINDEWIELYNSGEEIVSLENWMLRSEDGTPEITLAGSVPAGGYFLLERTDDSSVPNILADQIYTGSLGNGGEELVLRDDNGNEIDRTPSGSWPAGESSPEKRSMMRVNDNWETYSGDAVNEIFGSPGIVNRMPVPQQGFVSAKPTKVQISEISPVACGEDEWIEFEIWAPTQAIDITNWKLRHGTSEKSFAHFMHLATFHSGGISLSKTETGLSESGTVGTKEIGGSGNAFTEDQFVYLTESEEEPLRFSIIPSPLSLPDDGGSLEILDESGDIISSISWDESKSGEKDVIKWCEIWNWGNNKLWPLISWEDNFTHSRGRENDAPPSFPEELTFEIVEIAPDRDDKIDFVELLIREITKGRRLPNWSLRHNGTELFSGGGEIVEKGDRITLMLNADQINEDPVRWLNRTVATELGSEKIWESSTRNGLNASSGTLELNIWDGSSWETTSDFVCWAEENLSETEQVRLEKHQPDDWSGSCVNVAENIKNESIARQPLSSDGNTKDDFWRHFNGSPGSSNFEVNNAPVAKIMVQGGRRVYETSLNLTGFDTTNPDLTSSDPDGNHDLKSWTWEINSKSCGEYSEDGWEWSTVRKGKATCNEESAKSNPGLIYFDFGRFETFDVKLTVTDYSGASDAIEVTLDRDPFRVGGSGGNAFKASIDKWVVQELEKENKKSLVPQIGSRADESATDAFFADFIEAVDWSQIAGSEMVKQKEKTCQEHLFAKERVQNIDKSRLRKNIGLVLLL